MRHGETDWNARHLFQGQVNTSLNEKGREQARKARERVRELGLSFDCVYSSPIDRAAQTIEIVTGLDRSQIHLDDRLKEMDLALWMRLPLKRIRLRSDIFSTSRPLMKRRRVRRRLRSWKRVFLHFCRIFAKIIRARVFLSAVMAVPCAFFLCCSDICLWMRYGIRESGTVLLLN